MIFKIFSPKKMQKMAFQNTAKLCKVLIITLVFETDAIFFDENGRKSQKIVIITSTPAYLSKTSAVCAEVEQRFGLLLDRRNRRQEIRTLPFYPGRALEGTRQFESGRS
jgi:hypothetical protein